jgi:hypothetical protein
MSDFKNPLPEIRGGKHNYSAPVEAISSQGSVNDCGGADKSCHIRACDSVERDSEDLLVRALCDSLPILHAFSIADPQADTVLL